MSDQISLWDSVLIGRHLLTYIAPPLLGILLPMFNVPLSGYTRICLILLLENVFDDFEETGIILSWIFRSNIFAYGSTLFSFFAAWHVLRLLPPIARHIWGAETDDKYFRSMANAELGIFLYLAPAVIFYMVNLILSNATTVTIIAAAATGIWFLFPKPSRTLAFWKTVSFLAENYCKYEIDIRKLFILIYEAVVNPYSRWEINIVRARVHQKGPELPYVYGQLKPRHIRLLYLRQRWPFTEPTFDLLDTTLDDAPPFEAVSYTWGEKAPDVPISVQGRQILVTAAVEEFLYYRSSFFMPKLFWIDAICINQEDKVEKTYQLPLMRQIYRQSSRVIVWLGPPESLRYTYIVRRMLMILAIPELLVQITGEFSVNLLNNMLRDKEAAFKAMVQLFKHPWFQRIWIVQEITVGRTVHIMYNGICVEWDVIASAAKAIGSDPAFHATLQYHLAPKSTSTDGIVSNIGTTVATKVEQLHWPHATVLDSIREDFHSDRTHSLGELLLLTQWFKSTNPVDKIFALLGITSDGDDLPFVPNYEDSVQEVFIKTTAFLLSSPHWFLVLGFTGLGYNSLVSESVSKAPALPSWVPDYSASPPVGIQLRFSDKAEKRDMLGRAVILPSDPRCLRIQGVEFDTLEHMGTTMVISDNCPLLPNPEASDEIVIAQMMQFMSVAGAAGREWYNHNRQLARKHSSASKNSQEAADQEFWELCIGEESVPGQELPQILYPYSSPDARRVFEYFAMAEPEHYLNQTLISGFSTLGISAKEAVQMQPLLTHKFGLTVAGKIFCVTSNGSMSLLPPLARSGDKLLHFRGGYMPAILRPVEREKNRAQWIGTGNVYGVEDVYSGTNWKNWVLE